MVYLGRPIRKCFDSLYEPVDLLSSSLDFCLNIIGVPCTLKDLIFEILGNSLQPTIRHILFFMSFLSKRSYHPDPTYEETVGNYT